MLQATTWFRRKPTSEARTLAALGIEPRAVEAIVPGLCCVPAQGSFPAQRLSRVPKSGLPGFEKNSAKTKEFKQAFVGQPRNVCLESTMA